MWTLISLAVVAAPGVVAWWTGRRLLARRDDPALPERILQRSTRLTQLTAAAVGVMLVLPPQAPWMFLLPLLGLHVGAFPTRKALYEERWGLGGYLLASGRWWLAALGIWTLLALTPAIIHAAGPARWPVTALLAVVLIAWNAAYAEILVRVVGARPVSREDLAPRFAAILARSRAVAPRLLRFGFPGGRVVNAFALPSRRRPSVLFGDQLLELLEPDEVAAIFAHEVAHLEHFDGRRLARARITMWTIIGLAVLGIPLLELWTPSLAGILGPVWVAAVCFGLALRGAGRQGHETESDLRALELSGDADTLVRALVKLHALAHLPRRWALDFERNASHPSLARRVQAIRAAANAAPARLDGPLVVATATAGSFVVLESERAEWLEEVAAGTPVEATALRERATKSRAWRYSELVELRVRPGPGDRASLVATERSGNTWSVPLRREDVAPLQSALDVVDVRLAHRSVAAWWQVLLVRVVAAVGMMAALVATSALSVFVAALITFIRPHVAPLAALAVASIGAAFLATMPRESLAEAPALTPLVLVLLGAVALAALLLLRRGPGNAKDGHRISALTAGTLGAVAVASLFPLLGRTDPRLINFWELTAIVPNVFIATSGAGAALLGRGRSWGRWSGIVLLIIGVVPLGLGAAWPGGTSAIRWQQVVPTLLHRTELEHPGTGLRSSPSGQRLAVRVVRRSAGEAPWAFRILGAGDDRWELAGDDLAFLDDERLLVLTRGEKTLGLALVGVGGSAEPAWRVALPDVTGAKLTASPSTGAWSVIGSEPESDSVAVIVSGVVGREEIRVNRWPLESESDERSAWAMAGPETAFEVRTRIRADWYWRWPLLPTLVGRMPFDSEIWRRSAQGDRRVAVAPGVIRCMPATPADEAVVCLGYGTTGTRAWVFRTGSEAGPPAILPPSTWKVGLFRGRLLGMTSANTLLVLDEDGQRGVRLSLPRETGRSVDALLLGGRLAVLSARPPGAAVSFYALP